MVKYKLRLYIMGGTPASQNSIKDLRGVLEGEKSIKGEYELEVVDVLKRPQLAEDEKIIATPVLVKVLPEPIRKILGDLSDRQKVLVGLDLIKSKVSNATNDKAKK
jgi:circadian clock protein KaiB